MGVPLPVMCEPNGSMAIQSIMSNVAFCAEAKLHNKMSKAETQLNFRRSDFFTKTSAKAIDLLNFRIGLLNANDYRTQATKFEGPFVSCACSDGYYEATLWRVRPALNLFFFSNGFGSST
jgi:hypothetical protein